MHVAAQHGAIGVVHRVEYAGRHPPVLLSTRSRRGGLCSRLPTAERQRCRPNQYTSTQTNLLDFHNPPSYIICPASPISIDADSTIEKRSEERRVGKERR